MKARLLMTVFVSFLMSSSLVLALSPDREVLVPAAGRGGPWVTDLYVMNPGASTVSASVAWLVRNQANPEPITIDLELLAGETAVLEDVIFEDFGLQEGNGAFLVEADAEVIVNARIYATDGSSTFGQGFEGIPSWLATAVGQSTDVVGLTQGFGFRTNVYILAGIDGARINFSLRDPSGTEIASRSLLLDGYEPYLRRVDQLFAGLTSFPNATLHADVTRGAAVIGASKVDEASTDPTTLESATASVGGSPDGVYHFAIYEDSGYACGGNLVVEDGVVTEINGTYANFEKLDNGVPACELYFQWGFELPANTPVGDFAPTAGGVSFADDYTTAGSGVMTWTVQFEIADSMEITGTISAVGSEFTDATETGCNGTFPDLDLNGGKSRN